MIKLTSFDGDDYYINPGHVSALYPCGDKGTRISLVGGHVLYASEDCKDISNQCRLWRIANFSVL